MCFVDRAGDDAVVRLRAELRMTTVRVMADVSEEFGLARSGREDERSSGDRDEDLAGALLLDLAALLERLLVEHADHVARPLVDDDLFFPELLPSRRDAIPALKLRERDLEDAAEQVAERIADVRLGGRFRSPAFGAHAVGRRRVRPAVDALVAEPLRDVDGCLLRIDEVAFRAREPVLFLQDLVALLDFDERPLRILRIVYHSNLFRDRWEVEGEGLADHRLARSRWADKQEVPALIRGDPRERDRLVLADDPLQRIVRDRDLRGRLEVVEGESLIRGERLRSRDRLHPDLRREIAARPDLDAGRLFRDRAHLRADDRVHVHLGRDVQDPLRDDSVEDNRAGLLRGLERVDELPDRDLRHDAVPVVEEAGGGRSTELQEHVAVLLELRVEDLRRGGERRRWTIFAWFTGFPGFSRLPRFWPELGSRLGSRLRTRLGPSRGLRLGKLGLGLVDLA